MASWENPNIDELDRMARNMNNSTSSEFSFYNSQGTLTNSPQNNQSINFNHNDGPSNIKTNLKSMHHYNCKKCYHERTDTDSKLKQAKKYYKKREQEMKKYYKHKLVSFNKKYHNQIFNILIVFILIVMTIIIYKYFSKHS